MNVIVMKSLFALDVLQRELGCSTRLSLRAALSRDSCKYLYDASFDGAAGLCRLDVSTCLTSMRCFEFCLGVLLLV